MKINIIKPFFVLLLVCSCSKVQEYLPESILDLKLGKKLTGDEAINFVNRLHIESVTAEKCEIGFYEGLKGTATIFLTYYKDVNSAGNVFKMMTKKISPQNSIFSQGEIVEKNGNKIFKTFGRGQTHFIFVLNSNLFWISVENSLAEDYLQDYLDHID